MCTGVMVHSKDQMWHITSKGGTLRQNAFQVIDQFSNEKTKKIKDNSVDKLL